MLQTMQNNWEHKIPETGNTRSDGFVQISWICLFSASWWWLPSGHQVDAQWSPSGRQVTVKWSPSDLDKYNFRQKFRGPPGLLNFVLRIHPTLKSHDSCKGVVQGWAPRPAEKRLGRYRLELSGQLKFHKKIRLLFNQHKKNSQMKFALGRNI